MQHPAHKIYIYFVFTSHCIQCLYCREINNLTHDQHRYIRNQHKKCATVNLREAEHCAQWTRLMPCQSYAPTQHLMCPI